MTVLDIKPDTTQSVSAGGVVIADGSADHTAKLNTALAAWAVPGVRRKVTLIGDFKVTKLVIPSDVTVDAQSATITQIAGTSGNMLVTSANTPLRTVATAAMTAGSAVVDAAGAAFSAADVGRSVYIAGAGTAAGAGGQTGLYTTIASITSATQATLTRPAITTVAAASLKVYDRCKNITILGGTWDRQLNTAGPATGADMHSLCIRRVDHLTLSGLTVKGNTNRAHTICVGDITDFLIEDIQSASITESDYVHVNGPATRGRIQRISGVSGDDLVALTAMDYAAYSDVYGPITEISIQDISGNTPTCGVKLAGSQEAGAYLDQIDIRNVTRLDTTANFHAVQFLSDCGTLDVRNVRVSGVNGNIYIQGGHNANLPAYIKSLTVENSRYTPPTNSYAFVQIIGATVETLNIRGISTKLAALSAGPLVQLDKTSGGTGASIDVLNISDINWSGNTGTNAIAFLNLGTIGSVKISNAKFVIPSGAVILANPAGTVLPDVFLDNVDFQGGWLADVNCATAFWLANVKGTASNGIFRIRAAGAVTARGAASMSTGTLTLDAGGTARSLSLGIPADVSKLAKTAGDMATNTNAALSCGAGPVICDGTAWKHLFTGATY